MDRPIPTYSAALRRTPHRVRELKYGIASQSEKLAESHPSQGAGVEITTREGVTITGYSRTPHRVRELKSSNAPDAGTTSWGRTPHGVRELKL